VLGVYRKPERDEGARLGTLNDGDEVMMGSSARTGRWMHISWPLHGWIQARTRDGQPLLEEIAGQPNMRQIVSVRLNRGEESVSKVGLGDVHNMKWKQKPKPEPSDTAALREVFFCSTEMLSSIHCGEESLANVAQGDAHDMKLKQKSEPQAWDTEIAHFKKSAALCEATRLDKEASAMEAISLLGLRSQKALVGALSLSVKVHK
jgi:hypothetical protein